MQRFCFVLMLLVASSPNLGVAQESKPTEKTVAEIGFYSQVFMTKTNNQTATISHNLVKGYTYTSERSGIWGFAYAEKWYLSSTAGLYYDFTNFLSVGLAGGAETILLDDGLHHVYGRGAVTVLVGSDKLFVETYYENGASKEGWYEVDVMWRPSNRFGAGVLAQKGVGVGPRLLIQPFSHVPFEVFMAPYMYDQDIKKSNMLFGGQFVLRRTK